MVDFNYWLRQKYALLKQQADATTKNAETQRIAGEAAALVDTTKARLMPKESREALLKSAAERNLIDQQAAVVQPTALANIGLTNAQAGLVGEQTTAQRIDNTPLSKRDPDTISSIQRILGSSTPSMPIYRTSEIVPASTRRGAAGSITGR
jgi:hypothetical protein